MGVALSLGMTKSRAEPSPPLRKAPARSPLLWLSTAWLCLTGPAEASESSLAASSEMEPPWTARLGAHGYVDLVSTYNPNRPFNRANFLPGTGTSGKRANELSLNLAALAVELSPEPVGARLILNYGTGAAVVHSAEPSGDAVGSEVWRAIQQASLVWKASTKLGVEAGIYPSHIGFEVFPSQDNWTYTRSWMAEYSPYYQAGVKVSYAFTEHLSAQLHLLNGWQLIADNNQAKAVGTQVAWSSPRAQLTFNTLLGPELSDDDDHWRLFGDLVMVLHPTSDLQLGASMDAGLQQRPQRPDATWKAGAVFARLALGPVCAVAARTELFDDPDGVISGFEQRLWEGTLTLEVRPTTSLILKFEARYDRSTANVFAGKQRTDGASPVLLEDQALAAVGAVVHF